MRILIFSDSHGATEPIIKATGQYHPDLLIHLGDYMRDAKAVSQSPHGCPVSCVPGNCDISSKASPVKLETWDGVTLLITHGHLFRVKQNLSPLRSASRNAGTRIALFGHTHYPHNEDTQGILLFNPGSIAYPRIGNPTFGLLEIENGQIKARIIPAG